MEYIFSEKETKLLIVIFNQAYFKIDSPKPIQLRRNMRIIKREPIRLTFIKYLFQIGTNLSCGAGVRESIWYYSRSKWDECTSIPKSICIPNFYLNVILCYYCGYINIIP